MSAGNWILIGLVVLLILIVVFAKFYQKSSKDVAFVRTGLFGERVVLTGGTYKTTPPTKLIALESAGSRNAETTQVARPNC